MFCTCCGKKIEDEYKFCTSCGTSFSGDIKNKKPRKIKIPSFDVGKVTIVLIIIVVVGFSIYNSLDDEAIEINDEAISSFASGDSETSIRQLENAYGEAITEGTKMTTLTNLGYAYSTEGKYEEALQAFREAITYADKDSFDYFLIAGEIALLEGKTNAAQISYNKAYELRPNDFQINNALNLFYLDFDGTSPLYVDYPKALQYAKKAYEVSSANLKPVAQNNLAMAHFFNGNYDQAISLFLSLDINQRPYVAYWLGWSYAAKEDEINARFYFEKAENSGIDLDQEAYDYLNSY